MKNLKSAALAATILIAFSATPLTAAPKPVELGAAELAVHQSKTYAVPAKTSFGATIAALQSMGYTDIASNRDSGTITGITEAKAKTFLQYFLGLRKKEAHPESLAFHRRQWSDGLDGTPQPSRQ